MSIRWFGYAVANFGYGSLANKYTLHYTIPTQNQYHNCRAEKQLITYKPAKGK